MLQSRKKVCIFLALFVFATATIFAQNNLSEIDGEVTKMLLKKDLRLAIKEAEDSPANNLRSLLWRLSLYARVADAEKYTSTVKQILANSDFDKNKHNISYALESPLFQDYTVLQMYLQNVEFNGKVYEKFFEFCVQQKEKCDIDGFDKWLEKEALEALDLDNTDKYYHPYNSYFTWITKRITWREKFGLDNSGILNQFVENVRENPTDLDAALRYLQFFKSTQDISWLAETFASKQAFDYCALGEVVSNDLRYAQKAENEKQQIYQIAAQLLQKSLNLPFDEKDTSLIWSRRLRYTSVPIVLKNPEKQLRFWTETALAEVYKNTGEAAKAQPIVEELTNTDTSDIVSSSPSQLAGAVQMASGARAVESKILSEQGARQNSYVYWNERVAYYDGRQEDEPMFDAYKQSFSAVPFNLSNERSGNERLYFLGRFAEFAKNKFGYYGNSSNSESFNDEEKARLTLWLETENFLRNEFEKNRSNIRYSLELAEIITRNGFKKLSDEILSQNSELLVDAAKLDLINAFNGVFYVFFANDKVSQERKDFIFDQIFKILERKDASQALSICEALPNTNSTYTARLIPVLVRNLKVAERNLKAAYSSNENYSELKGLRNRYTEVLFRTYLAANDWKAAEKIFLERNLSVSYDSFYRLSMISINAAENGAFEDAARLWKIKANINRNNLENLSSLKTYPAVVENLREFYKKMQKEEPFSPIPEKALAILK